MIALRSIGIMPMTSVVAPRSELEKEKRKNRALLDSLRVISQDYENAKAHLDLGKHNVLHKGLTHRGDSPAYQVPHTVAPKPSTLTTSRSRAGHRTSAPQPFFARVCDVLRRRRRICLWSLRVLTLIYICRSRIPRRATRCSKLLAKTTPASFVARRHRSQLQL